LIEDQFVRFVQVAAIMGGGVVLATVSAIIAAIIFFKKV